MVDTLIHDIQRQTDALGGRMDTHEAKVQRDIALRDVKLAKRDIWLIATLVGFMAFGFTVLGFLIRLSAPVP